MSKTQETSGIPAPRWAWWIATGLGSGRLRPAPGTWGSLAALLAWGLFTTALGKLGLCRWETWPGRLVPELLHLLALLGLVWLAVRTSDWVTAESGDEDPGYIVIDEWVGVWVALWPLRWGYSHVGVGPWVAELVAAFVLFRLFDIWKPWPIRQIQILPGGQGIVADDLIAGLFCLPLVVLMVS